MISHFPVTVCSLLTAFSTWIGILSLSWTDEVRHFKVADVVSERRQIRSAPCFHFPPRQSHLLQPPRSLPAALAKAPGGVCMASPCLESLPALCTCSHALALTNNPPECFPRPGQVGFSSHGATVGRDVLLSFLCSFHKHSLNAHRVAESQIHAEGSKDLLQVTEPIIWLGK